MKSYVIIPKDKVGMELELITDKFWKFFFRHYLVLAIKLWRFDDFHQ